MKNLKCIYEEYIPRILRNKNQIKYNLSVENIFGNLHYSMSQDILKGKNVKMDYLNINLPQGNKLNYNPPKLLPILRIRPS
jgi:hypothetical protein